MNLLNALSTITRLLPPALVAVAGLFLAGESQAYFIATPGAKSVIDFSKPTRILLSGRGTDLGIQPQSSALGRALLYQRNFPQDQIILLSVFENPANKPNLVQGGWKITTENETKLDTKSALPELFKFKKIRSLELFGHNSPSLGTQTDGLGYRFDALRPEVVSLAPNFTSDAYAIFHGCNSGWLIAQSLSASWKIPVAGSFTGTRFERLHSDGHFYVATDSKAPSPAWAKSNPEFGVKCSQGGCLRMRPSYTAYDGKWGNYEGAMLPHYKFFCQGETRDCEKRMALSLYGYITDKSLSNSSSFEDFKRVARDSLCPVYADRKVTEHCHAELESVEKGGGNPNASYVWVSKTQPLGGEQLKCTLKACTGQMKCDDHSCTIEGRSSENAMTLAQEYAHFIRGYRALQEDASATARQEDAR